MAKKNFDDFLDSVEKPKRPTPEEAARLVAMVHGADGVGEEPPAKPPAAPKSQLSTAAAKKEKAAALPPAAKRGRPRTPRNEPERLYRLSVDLPGSLLLKLKGAAMKDGTDMKTYVRALLEEHLAGS